MKPVIIHSAAKRELGEAMDWYESRCPGLGLDLISEVEAAIEKLRRNPQLCPRYKGTAYRKQQIRRFPYAVFFLDYPDCCWVTAIAHGARRPGYWRARARE